MACTLVHTRESLHTCMHWYVHVRAHTTYGGKGREKARAQVVQNAPPPLSVSRRDGRRLTSSSVALQFLHLWDTEGQWLLFRKISSLEKWGRSSGMESD